MTSTDTVIEGRKGETYFTQRDKCLRNVYFDLNVKTNNFEGTVLKSSVNKES